MNQLPSPALAHVLVLLVGSVAFELNAPLFATQAQDSGPNLNPIDAAAHVECITPEGQTMRVSPASQNAPATIKDDAIVCPLREGKTVFIIAFSKVGLLDQLRFVNANAAACGELTISVSNSPLPADSPTWTAVDGAIPFAHKRLFNLSMLGVEARYVKLSFHVEAPVSAAGIAAVSGPAVAVTETTR